ncbi:MAG: HEAT repeat domain-containing protein [Bradymonadaceae bacterium]
MAVTPRSVIPLGRPNLTLWALVGLIAGALILVAVPAWAEGGSVRYSYEQVQVGGKAEWVLIPHSEESLGGTVDKATLERAFERLRRTKGTTYGKSTIEISGQVPDRARVNVKIDPDFGRFALIIMAETVYTLTEFGVPEVHFPGYATGGVRRHQVPFVGYTMTIPLWKALPPGKLTTAQVVMPDGKLVPVTDVYAQWRSNKGELRKQVYSYLKGDDVFTVISVTRMLSSLGELSVDEILGLFSHPSIQVRRVALEVLDKHHNDEKVLAAVTKALGAEKDANLSRLYADYLGKSQSARHNVEKTFFLLTRGTDEEAVEAVGALGSRKGDERVLEHLKAALEDKREAVALAAVESLGKLDADGVRITALGNTSIATGVRHNLAQDLARSRSVAARRAGLEYIATNTIDGHASMAIAELGKIGDDDARKIIEKLLGDRIPARRHAAVDAIRAMNKVESLPALAEASRKGTDASMMEEAGYSILSSKPLSAILEETKSRDSHVQRFAYRALGERAGKDGPSKQVLDTLEAGSRHQDALIRGAVARALGAIANGDALAVLEKMIEDRSAPVRRDVALALAGFRKGELAEELVKYLDDSSPLVVSGAIDALESRGDARALTKIQQLANAQDAQVRASAIKAMTTFVARENRDAVRQHMALLSGAVTDKSPTVQVAALSQLGRFNEEMAVTSIAIQVSAEDKELRAAAVRALGQTDHRSAVPLVTRALNDPAAEVRRAAIEALGALKDRSSKATLEKRVAEENDPELLELIRATINKL